MGLGSTSTGGTRRFEASGGKHPPVLRYYSLQEEVTLQSDHLNMVSAWP